MGYEGGEMDIYIYKIISASGEEDLLVSQSKTPTLPNGWELVQERPVAKIFGPSYFDGIISFYRYLRITFWENEK